MKYFRMGKAVMSKGNHESGSDRIAEAAENMDADIILNVQGDEPFYLRNHYPNYSMYLKVKWAKMYMLHH